MVGVKGPILSKEKFEAVMMVRENSQISQQGVRPILNSTAL